MPQGKPEQAKAGNQWLPKSQKPAESTAAGPEQRQVAWGLNQVDMPSAKTTSTNQESRKWTNIEGGWQDQEEKL